MSTATRPQPVTNPVAAPKAPVIPEAPAKPAIGSLPLPEGVDTRIWEWPYLNGIGMYHLLVPLAFLPWFFSWMGVALMALGVYVYGTLGINLCYHRILTHRGLSVPKWLERIFATLGVCCLEDTPARWVAIHRLHHQHSDEQPDPHSPLVTVMWGHMNWLFVRNRDIANVTMYERYARDVLKDPYYFFLERNMMWVWVNLIQWGLYLGAGTLIGFLMYGRWLPATQFGASVWLWGVIVRTVLVWHITWSVNSLSHIWGYKTYETDDNSRNNWFVAWISNGEGWHNNHHADQVAACHGHKWWEFDVTWITVQGLELVGLAKEVVRPKSWQQKSR